jgi:Flp pilus assembly protein TadG
MTPPRAPRDERGLALIFLALFLTILMIMAAIVVDIGNARQQRASAQSAVDGAALSAAQVLDTTKPSQLIGVFNLAANATYKSLFMNTIPASGLCAATAPAVCEDYQQTSNGVTYDVQVTTPFKGPGAVSPDTSMLNVKACWSVPTVFGRVIGQNSIPICATATAQNGVGTGGPSNGGCGTANELTTISDTLTTGSPGNQKITATFDTSSTGSPFPLDTSQIHFVVQTQYGNFIQLTKDPTGVSNPTNKTYGMTPLGGGTTVTLSYTLPTTIDTAGGAAYSNTFSANLQVTDTAGRHCGNASWSTCGLKRGLAHDPIFDGGSSGDGQGWGIGIGGRATADDSGGGDNDGKDLNTAVDADDTVWPLQGSLISAGTRVGAIYNDEWPLRAASVSMIIDGTTVGYGDATPPATGKWGTNTYAFVDPSTVMTASPGLPTPIPGMPAFGTVDNAVSDARANGGLQVTLMDTMANPMSGENVVVSTSPAVNLTTGLNGIALFSMPVDGTYTVSYSDIRPNGARPNGSFQITISGGRVTTKTPSTTGTVAPWPTGYNTKGPSNGLTYWGQSVAVMYNSTNLTDGWHSAVLFANDGDVTAQGGDCGIVAWAFSSTGGTAGPGTLHLVS